MSQSERRSVEQTLRECVLVTVAVLAMYALAAFPAYSLAGPLALEGASYAALLCLVPAWVVLLGGDLYFAASPMVMVAASTILRLMFVLGGYLAVRTARPEMGLHNFTIWLLVFYMVTLALETLLIARRIPTEPTKHTAGDESVGESPTNDA